MIRTLLTTTALAALLGTAVIAQDAPETPAPEAPATEAPAAEAPAEPTEAPEAPADDVTEGEEVDTDDAETTETDEPWDVSAGYTVADTDYLASRLIGQAVFSSSGEDAQNIGNVSDLVFSEDGQIEAVIIGVGGFLGIGEKRVAADFSALEFSLAADNSERWVLATSTEALEAAPEFVWAEDEPVEPMAPADPAAPAAPATQ